MLEKDDALEAKKRFSSLKRVILIYFIKDEFVIPPTSAKFDEYKDGKVIDLVETDFYKKDLIGIRKLKEDNKLSIISVDSYHTIDENCQKILCSSCGLLNHSGIFQDPF